MSGKTEGSMPAQSLRTRAEERFAKTSGDITTMPVVDVEKLVQELQVHQIELEMQNEELRRTQLELEASRDAYLDLYDFAPVGYLTLDRMGVILEANLTAATLLGIGRKELVRQKLAHFAAHADQDTLYRSCKEVLSMGARQTCEIRIKAPEDMPLYVRLEMTAVEDEKGSRNDCRAALIDITERKQAHEALRKAHQELEERVAERTAELVGANQKLEHEVAERKNAEKALEHLNRELDRKNRELESVLYVASHDLWSPLVNIKGFSGELNQACKTVCSVMKGARLPDDLKEQLETVVDEKIPRALDFIVAGVTKMDTLLDGLLRLSRLGQAAIQLEQLDMNAMLADIIMASEFQLREAGATLQIDTLPPCLGDGTQINQVFSNLLDNALKYLDPARPGVIRVHGHQDEGRAVYCVEDNGIGIAPEDQEKVFEAFRRLNPEGPAAGEGLGLPTIRRVLERHRGKIWPESEPGKGSRFFVSLPAQAT